MARCDIEIFDRDFNLLLHQQTQQPEIKEDYLSPEDFEVVLFDDDTALKGAYIHITGDIDYTGIVAEVTHARPDVGRMTLSVKSLHSLFDIEFLFDTDYQGSTASLENFLATTITDLFITNSDAEQVIPGLTVTATSTTTGWGFHITSTEDGQHRAIINLYDSIISRALEKYRVAIRPVVDYARKTVTVYIGMPSDSTTIEADLPNIIKKSITETTSENAVNKLIVYDTDGYGQMIIYYLHPDGTYDSTDADRITPVVLDVQGAKAEEGQEGQTGKTFAEAAAEIAAKTFGDSDYRDLIEIEVLKEDTLVNPLGLVYGQLATIMSGKKTYTTILTGREIAKTVKLTFGIVRVDLTKTLTNTIITNILNSQTIQQIRAASGKSSGGGGDLSRSDVVDNLTSTATDLPLSANQGRVLSEGVAALENGLNARFKELGVSNIATSSGSIMSGSTVRVWYSERFVAINYMIRVQNSTGRPTITISDFPALPKTFTLSGYPTHARTGSNNFITDASSFSYTANQTTATIGFYNFIGNFVSGSGWLVASGALALFFED